MLTRYNYHDIHILTYDSHNEMDCMIIDMPRIPSLGPNDTPVAIEVREFHTETGEQARHAVLLLSWERTLQLHKELGEAIDIATENTTPKEKENHNA